MKRLLRSTWLQLCCMVKSTQPVKMRDKAIAVAGRVTVTKDTELLRVSCPVCLDVIRAPLDSDIRMTLAVHLSLWHPDDVNLQWEIMQKKKESTFHLPSLVLGIGMAAGVGALLTLVAKNQNRSPPLKGERNALYHEKCSP